MDARDNLFDALKILGRTTTGLQNTITQDLTPLHRDEQFAIVKNAVTNYMGAATLVAAQLEGYLKEYYERLAK